ncbi:MAG: glycosyltransferase [Planctomycetes bacterium]|nr:glycosyltransferase [Planctomycetota bacterium]
MRGKRFLLLNNQGLDQRGGGVTMLHALIARLGAENEVVLCAHTQRARDAAALPGLVERHVPEHPAPRGPLWRLRPLLRARWLARRTPTAVEPVDVAIAFDCHFAWALPRVRAAKRVYVSLSPQARQESFDMLGRGGSKLRAWQYARLERAAIRAADLCIVSSATHAEEIRRYEGLPRFAPLILAPAIPPRRALPAPDARAEGELLVLTVARLIPLKNVGAVLEVASRVRDLPVRFAVLGDGPGFEPLRKRAAELGLLERVRFLGGTADPAPWLAAADLLLHPSRYESFGMAVFEGMCCGAVPIVPRRAAHFVSAATELVEHRVSGLVLDFEDPAAVASAVRELCVDPALRLRLSAAARARAQGMCEPPWAARFESALEELLR